MTQPLDLPQSVLDTAEFSPFEDILLYIIRDGLPGLEVHATVPQAIPDTFAIVRRTPSLWFQGDPRFVDYGTFYVHVFTHNPDGDEKGAVVSEAIRVVLFRAWMNHTIVPGKGAISKLEMEQPPSRKADWATSTGPVQYADLPADMWRYEATYNASIRRLV